MPTPFLPDRRSAGQMARNLRSALAETHGLRLKHTQAVDLIAAALGYRNRHEMAETQAREPDPAPVPESASTPVPLTPQQKLAAALYGGGDHAEVDSVDEATRVGDTLFHHLITALAPVGTDAEAIKVIESDTDRLDRLLEAMDADAPGDPEDAARGDLDVFQQFVVDAWRGGVHGTLSSRAEVDATGDLLLRFCVIEVSVREDCEDWTEAKRRLQTARDDLLELQEGFRSRVDSGAVPRSLPRVQSPSDLVETLEELARLLVRVIDNDGQTLDRYTLCFTDGTCLTLSESPAHPQGVSLLGDYDPVTVDRNVADGAARDLRLTDLPAPVAQHAILRVNEVYRDHLAAKAAKGMTRSEVLQQLDERRHDLCGMELQRDVL